MKKILILLTVSLSLFGTQNVIDNQAGGLSQTQNTVSNSNYSQHKLKAPLQNLFATTQWDLFLREFEMTMEIGTCCNKGDLMSCAVGLKAHMIEPIGYMETTQKPLKFPFAKLDLGGNVLKGNSLMEATEDNDGGRPVAADAHFIYMPIMGMIFKKKLVFACFHKGDLLIPYMSEFDPTWKQDVYNSKMIPHMIRMFTPQALVSSIFDCVATEVVNGINGYQEGSTLDLTAESMETGGAGGDIVGESNHMDSVSASVKEKMNMVRDTVYYVDGCNGFTPVGGYVHGNDVIQDATLSFHGIMSMLHGVSALSPVSFLSKQSNIFLNSASFPKSAPSVGNVDTMCRWKDYALPLPSQYLLQLAYPVVGAAKECGTTGANVSTAKNLPESVNSSAFVVWDRRDYYAFAYFCQDEEKK